MDANESSAGAVCSGSAAPIDETTRRVFALLDEEYDELCDRLCADDPVFSYQASKQLEPQ